MDEISRIISDCAANDRLSQEKLYRRFYPVLFHLCKRFFKDEHLALEVLNDGMLKVYRHISEYRPEKGAFFNWMYTIVRNTALDRCKLIKQEPMIELMGSLQIVGSGNPFKSLEWKDIYFFLDTLAPSTRVVCCLFYMEGMSIKEISENLEIKPGTIKWHLNEARRRLKPILGKHYL